MSRKEVRVDVVGDNKKLKQSVKESQSSIGKLGKTIQNVGKLMAGAFAVRAVVRFASESMKAYNVQAQAEQQLLVALKGREDAQRRLIAQAQRLQRQTLFGDEETIRAQALIAAFVKEESQIRTIIPLVQDLAAAKGMDLAGAADLVSKTLGSSTNALSRYGIEVTGAVGSTERLESLSKGLANAFEGQAQAAAKAGTGGLQQLQNRIGDLREAFGGMVNDIVTDVLPSLNKIVTGLELVLKGREKLKEEVWDESTSEAIENDAKNVQELADTYLKLGAAQTQQEAEQKAVNTLLIQYGKVLGYALDQNVIAKTEKQIAALKDMQVAQKEATKSANEHAGATTQLNEVFNETPLEVEDIKDSLIDLTGQTDSIVVNYRKWKIATQETAVAAGDLTEKNNELNASMEAGFAPTNQQSEALTNYKNQMAQLEQQIVSLAASVAGDLAFAFGEAAGGMDNLGDSIAELGVMLASSLGDILIAYGVALGPAGIPFVLGGLALKMVSGIASGAMKSQDQREFGPQSVYGGAGSSMLYGNDIRTSYNYSTKLNNKVG